MDPVAGKQILDHFLAALKEWNADVKEQRDRYLELTRTLEKAIETFKAEKHTLDKRIKDFLSQPLVTLAGVVILTAILINLLPCGTSWKYQGFELNKICPVVSSSVQSTKPPKN